MSTQESAEQRAYFDWNATAPLRAQARAVMTEVLSFTGNASSVHREGRETRAVIEESRALIAMLVGAESRNVTFTSGGTEANMLVLTPAIAGRQPVEKLIVSAIEHPSVLGGGRFGSAEQVPVTARGVIDLDQLEHCLARSKHALVSVMLANNETGIIQPVREVAAIVRRANGVLHVDAVQAAGRIPVDIKALGAHFMTLSAHKIGGPQGAGALISSGEVQIAQPLITGGGQERGLRAGTENVAAIAGFGAAAKAVTSELSSENKRLSALRSALEAKLKAIIGDVLIFGETEQRIPNTTLFARPGMKAETAIIAFDLAGIAVSSGAACSSGKVAASHVLTAMGCDAATAKGAIRISMGYATTESDVEKLLNAWKSVASSLSKAQSRNTEIAA